MYKRNMSPTQRSLKLLREQGYKPWIVEHWNSQVTWTLENAREKQVQHLVDMARKPGWTAYAKARSQELESQEMFKGITEEVRKRLKEQS